MNSSERKETRTERQERQAKEQFEELGRFVQSFELMVHAARTGVVFASGVTGKAYHNVTIIVNHDAMSAKPLFDILRAITVRAATDPDSNMPMAEQELLKKVLTQVASRYAAICDMRNNLLHGTWHIGWASQEQEDFSSLNVSKLKVTKAGLAQPRGMPADTAALYALRKKCEDIADVLTFVPLSLNIMTKAHDDWWPSKLFSLVGEDWFASRKVPRPEQGKRATLP